MWPTGKIECIELYISMADATKSPSVVSPIVEAPQNAYANL